MDAEVSSYLELERERKRVQDEISPLQVRLHDLNSKINKFNENLPYGFKKLICDKLWENTPPGAKERIEAKRKETNDMLNGYSSYCLSQNKDFDPYFDKWRIVSFEEEGDNIRFSVSCVKNEGSISGLMTFLDVHWTPWFPKSEIE